jgi:hypothetical protein
MEPQGAPLTVLFALVSFAATAAVVTFWLKGRGQVRNPMPVLVPRAIDHEPHTLMRLSPDGRPNPAAYENFPDYLSALLRQRELSARGHASVITHSDSGEIRINAADLLAGFKPFQL